MFYHLGSVRNRLADLKAGEGDAPVLLDENLLHMIRDSPLYVRPNAKSQFMKAIKTDSRFLAVNTIIDYSLLVGIDDQRRELVVGVIDYVRNFTLDKKLEMAWKMLISQGKAKPTIMAPDYYQERFSEKMDLYFLAVPDQFYCLDMNAPSSIATPVNSPDSTTDNH